jgi:hypothetical protein
MYRVTLPIKIARMIEDHLQLRFQHTVCHNGMVTIYTHAMGFASTLRSMGKYLSEENAGEKAHIDIQA